MILRKGRSVGRPARVNIEVILDAALGIGLEQVTMRAVADHLGVGISTLYQYVENRNELVRLAALRQALARTPPKDTGQHWAHLAVQYAQDLMKALVDEPQLLVELLKGGLGPRMEVDLLEHFLSAMQAHQFTPAEGIRLYRKIGMVAIGGAVGEMAVRAGRATNGAHPLEIRRILAERELDDLPLLRSAEQEYQRDDDQVWLTALHELLGGIARNRGEALPPSFEQLPTFTAEATSNLSLVDPTTSAKEAGVLPVLAPAHGGGE